MQTICSNTSIISSMQGHYTPCQFIFPQEFEEQISLTDSVRTLKRIMGGMNLEKYKPDRDTRGRIGYNYRSMLEIVLYAYSRGIYSLRKIEDACRNDIRFMWLSGNIHPSHKTIGEFINEGIGEKIGKLFKEVNDQIENHDEIDSDTIYIDGTKILANATKFSFVWKKATQNYQKKLIVKMDQSLKELNEFFKECNIGKSYLSKGSYTPEDFIEVFESLKKIKDNVETYFVHGRGRHKDEFQRFYERFEGYKNKAIEYAEKIQICGERNSYSKTDQDATFMHGKEDYYSKTGIFKAYYNVQVGVSNEYIRMIEIYQNPADTRTFQPLLNQYYEMYGNWPKYPVADAGYGSYENYMYCLKHGMELVQKYAMIEKEKNKKDRFKSWNYKRDEEGNILCPNGYKFEYEKDSEKIKSGILYISQVYKCRHCTGCPLQEQCNQTKDKTEKSLSINVVLEEMKAKVRENLTSELGIKQRVRRSIEAEGTFGIIKQDWDYNRIHRRGIEQVRLELYLVAIGYNLKKFHQKTVIRKIMN